MRPVRRILVAVKDPQSRSLPAVAKAAQLAKALDARLELFHAIDTPLYADLPSLERGEIDRSRTEWRNRRLAQLERIAERMRRQGLEVSTTVEWDYPVYEAVVRRAVRSEADLIVAERHAGVRVAPWLLHVTDWELLRYSPLPVLIVKTPRPYRRPVVLAAVDPSHAFEKPAKLDQEVLGIGGTVATALRGTLHAVHAYAPLPPTLLARAAEDPGAADRISAETAKWARSRFERALRSAKIPPRRRHLVGRHPIDAILDVARQTRAAIVVMGAVSRSGLRRLFIGNTAERVLDDLPCDLLVVKPRGFPNRVPRAKRGPRVTVIAPSL
ncbi:MAG: universal stress protein [Pseudomonadota bacterium]|jgi:Universal stress protein UspA and related nucleotide-binding proteins|nr:MAG: hypothetical protein DIU56_14320 [Pseudomonadota bacterium]